MTKLEINKVEYNVPESFDDVTIDQLARIVSLLENKRDELTMNTEIINVLTDIDISDLPFEVGVKIFSLMSFLSDMSGVINADPINEAFFVHKGEKYNIPKTINFITFSQYWALDKLIELYPGNKILDQAALIIGLLCHKDDEQYTFPLAKHREVIFKELPSTLACSILNSFFLQSRVSNELMKLYLMAEEELEGRTVILEKLIENGNGTRLSGRYAKSLVRALKQRKQGKSATFSIILLGKKIWTILGKLVRKKGSIDKKI